MTFMNSNIVYEAMDKAVSNVVVYDEMGKLRNDPRHSNKKCFYPKDLKSALREIRDEINEGVDPYIDYSQGVIDGKLLILEELINYLETHRNKKL